MLKMQENIDPSNFHRIISTWRRLSGEQSESAAILSMSGDSPDYQSHKKEEEQKLVVPDNSKASVAIGSGTVATATIGVPTTDGPGDSTATTTPTEKQEFIKHEGDEAPEDTNDDNDSLEHNEPLTDKSPGNNWDPQKERIGDKVDSVYLRPPPAHKARSTASTPEEESCGFKCLYYTLECCDCVIM